MKKRINEQVEFKGRWLLTFNDMMTLLFAFFVLIISMSRIEPAKVRSASLSVLKVLGIQPESRGAKINVIEPLVLPLSDQEMKKAKTEGGSYRPGGAWDKRLTLARPLRNLEGAKVIFSRNGLSVSLEETLIFSPGSAEIIDKGDKLLDELGKILQRTDVYIRVEDYADELYGGKYRSGWELSTVRAVNVVKYLASEGGIAPDRLSAVGYGCKRQKVYPASPQNRQLKMQMNFILTFPEN